MKALVKTKSDPGYLELLDVPVPEPGVDQIRIKVKRAGICQTDIEYYKVGDPRLKPPVILGHEVSGVVDKVGEGVTNFKPGDRVISQTTFHVCGVCRYCHIGQYNHCVERKGIGSAADGGFAEYLIARAQSVMHLPDNLSFEEGAAVEPLACGVHALTESTNIPLGSVVVVMGPGAIGLLAAQVAKAQGAYVMLTGLTQDVERLKLARELGIDRTVNLQEEDLNEVVKSVTDGYGADFVVEATGAKAALNTALNIVRKKGTVITMGVFPKPIEVDFYQVHIREITIVGSKSQIPESWPKALKLLEQGKVSAKPIVTHVYPMSNWQEAFDTMMSKKGLKIMINPEE